MIEDLPVLFPPKIIFNPQKFLLHKQLQTLLIADSRNLSFVFQFRTDAALSAITTTLQSNP